MTVRVEHGDSREVLKSLPDESIHACVTDPPYSLVSIQKRFGKPGQAEAKFGADGLYQRASRGFMGTTWDTGETAFDPDFWREVLRVLKPGAHLIAFSGTRTYHRMTCAIEDAGFEIRDQIGWVFGSGFPKSHDIAKHLDKQGGVWRGRTTRALPNKSVAKGTEYERVAKGDAISDAAREWEGFGTALKPAWEPMCVARKPLSEKTIAANVLKHGCAALNIDACRIGFASDEDMAAAAAAAAAQRSGQDQNAGRKVLGEFNNGAASIAPYLENLSKGRWPANLCHDGSEEVIAAFPDTSASSMSMRGEQNSGRHGGLADLGTNIKPGTNTMRGFNEAAGSAARFFYSAKADASDRLGSKHPTVKPVDLMRWLVRLVTPPNGTVLDPFAGTGTTGMACMAEGFDCILIEREAEYVKDIKNRIAHVSGENAPLFSGKII